MCLIVFLDANEVNPNLERRLLSYSWLMRMIGREIVEGGRPKEINLIFLEDSQEYNRNIFPNNVKMRVVCFLLR